MEYAVTRWFRLILSLLCVVLMAGGALELSGVVAAQEGDEAPDLEGVTVTPNDCAFLIKGSNDPRQRLGDIACGTLDVPENWSEPEGRRLQLGYVVLKSTGAEAMPDPVIHLGGGPGISPLTASEAWANAFSLLRQERDVVLFDQRGTRLSSPLRCEAYTAVLAVDSPTGQSHHATGLSRRDQRSGRALAGRPREVRPGHRRLRGSNSLETGVDLTQYNSLASANDVIALVKALGYDTYNLYGVSYGTRLALEVMRSHPESGLRSVVLDSTYPPEIKSYEEFPQEPHQVAIQLFADCARDAACDAAYPDLKARFIALLDRMRAEPVVAADGTDITDRDLIAVMQTLGANIPVVPYVPRMIAELERGEAETYLGIANGSLLAPAEDAAEAAGTPEATAAATPEEMTLDDFSPARRFVLEVQARIDAGPEGEASQFLQLLSDLDAREHERQTLRDFVERAFPGPEQAETRATLQAAIDAMSDADVQEVFVVVAQEITLADLQFAGQTVAQYYSVECNERAPFQSFAAMVENAQQLEIPDLALGVPESFVKVFAICERWQSGQAPAGTDAPVWSDIPTLVLAGSYDNLTPVSWNKSAFVTLPNGTFVLAPMSGHGVIAYSACAQQIGAAFIADPAATVDMSCLAGLEPEWALP